NFFLGRAVSLQGNSQYQIVVWFVDLVYYVKVECLYAGDTFVGLAFGDQGVSQSADEDTEDVTCSEMYPYRGFFCILSNFFNIVGRKSDAGCFPLTAVFDTF